jgi:hypothetical protein
MILCHIEIALIYTNKVCITSVLSSPGPKILSHTVERHYVKGSHTLPDEKYVKIGFYTTVSSWYHNSPAV